MAETKKKHQDGFGMGIQYTFFGEKGGVLFWNSKKNVLCHILRGMNHCQPGHLDGTWGFGYWISCPNVQCSNWCTNSTRVTNWWTRSELHLGYMEKWWNGESLPSFIVSGVKIRCSLQGFSIHQQRQVNWCPLSTDAEGTNRSLETSTVICSVLNHCPSTFGIGKNSKNCHPVVPKADVAMQ